MKKVTQDKVEVVDEKLAELKKQFGTVYTISGISAEGKELKMYLRNPDYKTRKRALEILMKNQEDIITAGEVILAGSFIDGDNLYADEANRLEAAIQASQLVDFNTTLELKKN